jgi:Ca2+-binding RTX toxin-like protein
MAFSTNYSRSVVEAEFQANSFEAGNQFAPHITGLTNGNSVVAYNNSGAAGGQILVDFYDADHNLIGNYRIPHDGATEAAGQPQVIQLTNGTVLVAWKDEGDNDAGIKARLYDINGQQYPDELTFYTGTDFTDLKLTALDNGEVVMTFTQGGNVMQGRFAGTGILDGGFFQVNSALPGNQGLGAVAGLSTGGYVVTYTDTAPSDQVLHARIYNADGTTKVNDFVIDSFGDNTASKVVGLEGGNWAVVYTDSGWGSDDAGNLAITLKVFDGNGDSVTGFIRVNAPSSQYESEPDVTMLENGFIAVTWRKNFDIIDNDVLARVFMPDGTPVTDEFTLNVSGGSDTDPSIAGLLAGKFMTVWQDNTADSSSGRISSTVTEIVRTTTAGLASDTVFTGDELVDNIFGHLGNDVYDGQGGDDQINGNGGDDTLIGDGGNDRLDGGEGNDTLDGGSGDDRYFVDATGDMIIETAGNGTDLVAARDSFALAADDDIETLSTANYKGTLAIDLAGNALSQEIYGNNGVNLLKDGGGAADTLQGLDGNDTYLVYAAGTVVLEEAGKGSADKVAAAVDFVLGAGVEVEILSTTSNAGKAAIDLTGNALAQTITGNAGDNILHDGGAGAADTMKGLGGNDTYRVYNSGDLIAEAAGQGTADKVAAAVDYKLGAGVEVEIMTTNGSAGKAAIDLTGNALKQEITGNAGDNILHDGGAGSADTMKGLGGNDTYRIFNSGDLIVEAASQGSADKVVTAVDYKLGAGVHVEIVQTNGSAGKASIDLTGNEIAQTITGNAGVNRIDGKGGIDTLQGGGGADTFVFSSALGAGNVDTIVDFNVAADTIELENAIFTVLNAPGTLAAAAFRANTTGLAADASDRIVYETDTGELYYDADGNGAGASVLFAKLDTGLSLTNADFSIA